MLVYEHGQVASGDLVWNCEASFVCDNVQADKLHVSLLTKRGLLLGKVKICGCLRNFEIIVGFALHCGDGITSRVALSSSLAFHVHLLTLCSQNNSAPFRWSNSQTTLAAAQVIVILLCKQSYAIQHNQRNEKLLLP